MTETEKYKLKKPDKTDYAKIETLNDNADVIDAALAEQAAAAAEDADALAAHLADRDNPHGVTPEQIGAIAADTLGQPGGPAQLGADGKLPADQLGDVGGGGSLLTLRFDAAFLGCAWTLTGGGETYSGTVDSSLTATASVKSVGTTYTLAAELDGVTYIKEMTTAAYFTALTMTLEKFTATIAVTVESGSTVTATLGSMVLTKTSTGTAVFTITRAGTWTIKATLGRQLAKGTVSITDSGQSVTLDLVYVDAFGVCWDTSNSSTALTRLTPETDPYGYVTQSVTAEPVPAVGTGAGSSPFDEFMPWAGMKECNLNNAGEVTAWKGDSNFSIGFLYTMVYIPEFYFKYEESGTKKYFYISDRAGNDFVKHPGSGKFVGKYVCTQDTSGNVAAMYSQFGGSPGTNITRAKARTLAKENGAKFHLYDFATHCAIVLLYVVEFADWDCQTKIGRGIVASSTAQSSNNGWYPNYHTGRSSSTADTTAVQYRGIYNLWGNVSQWVDGFNANGKTAYYCVDPSKYADDTTTGYTKIGTLPSTGWVKDLTVTDDGLLIPKTSGGSSSTYIPDYMEVGSTAQYALYIGGNWGDSTRAGLLRFITSYASSSSSASVSARLMCEP